MHAVFFLACRLSPKGSIPISAQCVTVNKPDLLDVYKLTLNPDNDDEYMLDGVPRAFESRRHWLKIKLLGNFFCRCRAQF